MDIIQLLQANIILSIVSAIGFVLFISVVLLHIKVRGLLMGKNAKSLEDTIIRLQKEVGDLHQFKRVTQNHLADVEQRLEKSIQSVETIRFNPFKGTGAGGNQSFATAFLNEKGDGVVLSSLYARDRVSVFSKPIKKLSSEHELSDEEKEALERARVSLSNSEVK